MEFNENDVIYAFKMLKSLNKEDLGKVGEVGIKAFLSTILNLWARLTERTKQDVLKVLVSMMIVESQIKDMDELFGDEDGE